jgi:hypothetical protein
MTLWPCGEHDDCHCNAVARRCTSDDSLLQGSETRVSVDTTAGFAGGPTGAVSPRT